MSAGLETLFGTNQEGEEAEEGVVRGSPTRGSVVDAEITNWLVEVW